MTPTFDLLLTVIAKVFAPPWLSPTFRCSGERMVFESSTPRMSSMPAPWRCAKSRKPRVALPDQGFGSAVFCSSLAMTVGLTLPLACRMSATAPATCGEDIEVPDRAAMPPSSSG